MSLGEGRPACSACSSPPPSTGSQAGPDAPPCQTASFRLIKQVIRLLLLLSCWELDSPRGACQGSEAGRALGELWGCPNATSKAHSWDSEAFRSINERGCPRRPSVLQKPPHSQGVSCKLESAGVRHSLPPPPAHLLPPPTVNIAPGTAPPSLVAGASGDRAASIFHVSPAS